MEMLSISSFMELIDLSLIDKIQAVQAEDQQTQKRLHRRALDWWEGLGYTSRRQRIERGIGLEEQWDVSDFDEESTARWNTLQNADRVIYNRLATETIATWARHTFSERMYVMENIRDQLDFGLLNADLINTVEQIEITDIQERFDFLNKEIDILNTLSFEEREEKRATDNNLLYDWNKNKGETWFPQGLQDRYATTVKALIERLEMRMEDIERRDDISRIDFIIAENQKKIETWNNLTLAEREQANLSGQGIETQLNRDHITAQQREQIILQQERDQQARNQLAENIFNTIQNDMAYLGTLESVRFHEESLAQLKTQIDVSKLSLELMESLNNFEDMILKAKADPGALAPQYRTLSESRLAYQAFYHCQGPLASIIEKCDEGVINQWVGAKATEDQYNEALRRYETPLHLLEYERIRIKLFPILCGDSHYPSTQNGDLNSLYLNAGHNNSLRLEIHSNDGSIPQTVLTERVKSVFLEIPDRDNFISQNNKIRYILEGGDSHSYDLRHLMDYTNTQKLYHIQIIPEGGSTEVKWQRESRSIGGHFRGIFLLTVAFYRRDEDDKVLHEWSLINNIGVEQYVQSVTASEMPRRDSTDDVLMAQAILARSYAMNNMLNARKILGRLWDLNPTTCFQSYTGSRSEDTRSNQATQDTKDFVLAYNGRPAFTEYHASWTGQTRGSISNRNPIIQPRKLPDNDYIRQFGRLGHGRGMPQRAAISLARDGWTGAIEPSTGVRIPVNIHSPWNYEDLLFYFYSQVYLENWRTLSL